jgi:hypothetical protein
MDVNQKYCQSCHLISRLYHYENNELTDMLLMYGQCYHVIRMQLRRPESSREYAERFPEKHHPGPRQLLI